MPTFNYLCTCASCNHIQEEFRLFSERTNSTNCKKCGTESIQTVSKPLILFDGSNPDNIAAHDRWVKHHEQKGNGVRTQ
jgi:putative FmdB family regulatory protein